MRAQGPNAVLWPKTRFVSFGCFGLLEPAMTSRVDFDHTDCSTDCSIRSDDKHLTRGFSSDLTHQSVLPTEWGGSARLFLFLPFLTAGLVRNAPEGPGLLMDRFSVRIIDSGPDSGHF